MGKTENTTPRQSGSGGVIAINFGQGSRAEILAQYFFSEFCVAERVVKENDFGIDLYCSLMSPIGSIGLTSSLFAVQIKSGNALFKYKGENISQWLKLINIPLLMCRVDRLTLTIKIYTTWRMHELLSNPNSFTEINFIESYSDEPDADNLKGPVIVDNVATVWMGPPIIQCTLHELIDPQFPKNEISVVLNDWVTLECLNYTKRHFGITAYYGYTKWVTNRSLRSSERTWYRPHVFNIEQSKNAIHRILESTTMIAFNQGKENAFVQSIVEALRSNGLIEVTELDEWHREQIGLI